MVTPVVRAIAARAGWVTHVLAATTAGPEMTRQGIPWFGYTQLLREGDDDALRWGRELLADSHDPASGISVDESIAYLGLCYRDLVGRLGDDEARRRYEHYGRHAFLPLAPLRRAIERARPDVLVTTNSPKSERAALLVAREMSIPSIYIEDLLGIHSGAHLELDPLAIADRFCVGSTIAADNARRRYGVSAGQIRLTGNPAFDRLALLGDRERDEGRLELRVGRDRSLIAYMDPAGTPPEAVAALAAEIRGIRGARFVARRHPNNRTVPSAEYATRLGQDVALAEEIGLDRLLMAADVVLSVASTTAVEAVLLGRQVIQLGVGTGIPAFTGDRAEDLPLFRHGCATLVEDVSELRDAIRSVLGSSGQEIIAAARRVFVEPGHAAASIADEMTSLARVA